MGTRNLTCVAVDGEIRVAQYCQWDGYPEGQGATICDFLRDDMFYVDRFAVRVRNLTPYTQEEVKRAWLDAGATDNGQGSLSVSLDVAKEFGRSRPELSRDTGAEILAMIDNGSVTKVELETEFAGDSLFCEWAYVLDLDREILEVYKGFNTGSAEGRFADTEKSREDYSPVTLIGEVPFNEASVDAIKAFEPEEQEA